MNASGGTGTVGYLDWRSQRLIDLVVGLLQLQFRTKRINATSILSFNHLNLSFGKIFFPYPENNSDFLNIHVACNCSSVYISQSECRLYLITGGNLSHILQVRYFYFSSQTCL